MGTDFFNSCNINYRTFVEECDRLSTEEVHFCVVQCDKQFHTPDQLDRLLLAISEFYNQNWVGNRDYIHIPTAKDVFRNYLCYPILMAYTQDEMGIEILGCATIKNFENCMTFTNPYYPLPNNHHFEITGSLTKRQSTHRNIGKSLYEIAIIALKKMQAAQPFDLIFVADARNHMSLNATQYGCQKASCYFNENLTAQLVGLYTVREDEELVEFPTFVVKINLNGNDESSQTLMLDYHQTENMFADNLAVILASLNELGIKQRIDSMDDNLSVSYYELQTDVFVNISNIKVQTNGTDQGNDRTPAVRTRTFPGGANE